MLLRSVCAPRHWLVMRGIWLGSSFGHPPRCGVWPPHGALAVSLTRLACRQCTSKCCRVGVCACCRPVRVFIMAASKQVLLYFLVVQLLFAVEHGVSCVHRARAGRPMARGAVLFACDFSDHIHTLSITMMLQHKVSSLGCAQPCGHQQLARGAGRRHTLLLPPSASSQHSSSSHQVPPASGSSNATGRRAALLSSLALTLAPAAALAEGEATSAAAASAAAAPSAAVADGEKVCCGSREFAHARTHERACTHCLDACIHACMHAACIHAYVHGWVCSQHAHVQARVRTAAVQPSPASAALLACMVTDGAATLQPTPMLAVSGAVRRDPGLQVQVPRECVHHVCARLHA